MHEWKYAMICMNAMLNAGYYMEYEWEWWIESKRGRKWNM